MEKLEIDTARIRISVFPCFPTIDRSSTYVNLAQGTTNLEIIFAEDINGYLSLVWCAI